MRRRPFVYLSAAATLLLALAGCGGNSPADTGGAGGAGGTGGGGGAGAGGGMVTKVLDQCDPLVPTACVLPFPSNKYLVDGGDTPSGKKIVFPELALPLATTTGVRTKADGFAYNDGFSAGLGLMTHLPGATVTGLPRPDSIAHSLDDDCPTVVIDAETGERVPHFAELDMSHDDDTRRTFIIRPVVRLKDATRYIVAIRDVVDADGKALAPTPAFLAFRDHQSFDHPSIEPRRALYEDIFTRLEQRGVARKDLQIAWDFTTATREGTTRWMLKVRDDALAQAGTDGPPYVIDSVTDDPETDVARRIEGRITVPLYLDTDKPGAHMVFGDDGLPKQNGTAQFPFSVQIPKSVATAGTPAPILQYGHGLFGGRGEIGSDAVRGFSDTYGYVVVATDWAGMSGDDVASTLDFLSSGDMSEFRQLPERTMQGFVNAFLAMRAMMGKLGQDDAMKFNGVSVIDPAQRYYYGNSQGGILGTCYMGLSTDVTRGVLGVSGQPFNLLLNRSQDFAPFFTLLKLVFPDPIDREVALGLTQLLWDRAEPTGYSPYITSNMLPGTPQHEVLLQDALGDHQVTTLGAHVTARTVGAKAIKPAVRPIFGVEEVDGPYSGSAIVEYDFGMPPEPIDNVPVTTGDDTHESTRRNPAAQKQMNQFLRQGTVENFCDGPCVFN